MTLSINRTRSVTLRTAALAWMLLAAVAHADGARKLTLSVYQDTLGAKSVLDGKYDDAIKQLGSRMNFLRDEIAATTNLCVAQIMTRQWTSAQATCDKAVRQARFDTGDRSIGGRSDNRSELALAYSNRAVLHWLQNKPEDAASDVGRAHALAPHTDFVSQNWTVLNSKPESTVGPAIAAIHN